MQMAADWPAIPIQVSSSVTFYGNIFQAFFVACPLIFKNIARPTVIRFMSAQKIKQKVK